MCTDCTDVSSRVRDVLARAGQGTYETAHGVVTRQSPPWMARVIGIAEVG